MLKVKGITKIFFPLVLNNLPFFRHPSRQPLVALSDVSFSLEFGQVLALLGPNGAGKTTLLKIVANILLPDKGEIIFDGLNSTKNGYKLKRLIGLVTNSERTFYWRLTGRQNLEFFASLYGLSKKQTSQQIEKLSNLFEIDFLDKRFDNYSTGMQQKIGLVRAFMHEPRLLLLDEPSKSLDYRCCLKLREFLKHEILGRQKATVIFTTHRWEEAEELATLYLIIKQGRVCGFGTQEELRQATRNPKASVKELFLELTSKQEK
ncbi:MAG: ABC transporter ATP-binding protein [Candidatus Omnitrophica bacterium]|nr:ABC transporter ATP-binding protein [Candidatus Omnitrophota bacterium]